GSGNDAIDIYGTGTDGNIVAGNFIGTDVTGTQSLGIVGDGVFLAEGASSNWIGVNPSGGQAIQDEGNVISGNGYDGVQIVNGANFNVVAGNKIGTDVSGTAALGNSSSGVEVDAGCANNTIGGLTTGAGVFHGFDFTSATSPAALTLQSDLSGPPEGQTSSGPTAVYRIDLEMDGMLQAIVHPQGLTARLMLLDSQGRVLVQSDGLSPSDPDSVIDQDLAAGNYSLVVES